MAICFGLSCFPVLLLLVLEFVVRFCVLVSRYSVINELYLYPDLLGLGNNLDMYNKSIVTRDETKNWYRQYLSLAVSRLD